MRLAFVTAFVTIASVASSSRAAPCDPSDKPWIRVEATALPNPLRDSLIRQLRAAFARRGLVVCEEAGQGALATATLASAESDVRITLSIRDAVTDKTVERTVKLGDLPKDAHAFALAQMTDELVRASWAELTVEDAPPPAVIVPPEVHDAIPRPRTAETRVRVGPELAFEHFSHDYDQLGVDTALAVRPWPRLGFVVRAGPRFALGRDTVAGSVSGRGFLGAAGPVVGLVQQRRFGLDVEADVGMLYVHLEGQAMRERSADGVAVLVFATASTWVRVLDRLRFSLDVGGGGALRGVRVSDGVRDLGGPAGALFSLRLGAGIDL